MKTTTQIKSNKLIVRFSEDREGYECFLKRRYFVWQQRTVIYYGLF